MPADDDIPPPSTPTPEMTKPSSEGAVANGSPLSVASSPSPPQDIVPSRLELLEQARAFLTSPQVVHEDHPAKRRFLVDKGLTEMEITGLLNELPPPAPVIPPRTYPQPPPSNLPNLLTGVARILTWFAGGSAILIVIYFRYILPRLSQTYGARLALRDHQQSLLDRLTASASSLKDTQQAAFAGLPQPERFREQPNDAKCNTIEELTEVHKEEAKKGSEAPQHLPQLSVLRVALQELTSANKHAPSTDELFAWLESKLSSLTSKGGPAYLNSLWETLNTAPIFQQTTAEDSEVSTWSIVAPPPTPSPKVIGSLDALHTAAKVQPRARQPHLLQALADLTGFLTAQAYALPTTFSAGRSVFGADSRLSTEAEEVRREIRALKGLVLNRRSFMPPSMPPANARPASSTLIS